MWGSSLGTMFGFGAFGMGTGFVVTLLIAWTLVWKGLALWKAARVGSKIWFVALLVINTVGILEILYLYVFSRKSTSASNLQKPAV